MQRRLMHSSREHNERRHDDNNTDQAAAELRQRDRQLGRKMLSACKLLLEANEIEDCLTFMRDEYPAILLIHFTFGLLGLKKDVAEETAICKAKDYLHACNTRELFMGNWRDGFSDDEEKQSRYGRYGRFALAPQRKEHKTMQRLSSAPGQDFLVPLPNRTRMKDVSKLMGHTGCSGYPNHLTAHDWENIVKYLEEYLATLQEAIGAHFRD